MTIKPVNVCDLNVQVSVGLSCGCNLRKSSAFPQIEAAGVGQTVICDRHQEYAVVIRHTRYLADQSERALSLLLRHLFDEGDEFHADAIASDQAKH